MWVVCFFTFCLLLVYSMYILCTVQYQNEVKRNSKLASVDSIYLTIENLKISLDIQHLFSENPGALQFPGFERLTACSSLVNFDIRSLLIRN